MHGNATDLVPRKWKDRDPKAERRISPVNCRRGGVETVRFTTALLDDRELLERSRMAEGQPGTRGGMPVEISPL